MDQSTLAAYDAKAPDFAKEWDEQPTPSDMQDLLREHFRPGPTADVGCGAGRDTSWLARNGWPATGFDASVGLLAEGLRLHPEVRFQHAVLPELAGVADASFTNVLCETVIMHLKPGAVEPSVKRLLAILAPGGTLYLSWRVTEGDDTRDPHGRLYAAFDPEIVIRALGDSTILLDEQRTSVSSGKTIRRVIARKTSIA